MKSLNAIVPAMRIEAHLLDDRTPAELHHQAAPVPGRIGEQKLLWGMCRDYPLSIIVDGKHTVKRSGT